MRINKVQFMGRISKKLERLLCVPLCRQFERLVGVLNLFWFGVRA